VQRIGTGVRPSRAGYPARMGIINRIVDAILVVVTAPFRAIAALFGRRR
jgi:hypothetical protein